MLPNYFINNMFKQIGIFLTVVCITGLSFWVALTWINYSNPQFNSLSPEQMYQTLKINRFYAIAQAQAAGDYKCCIEPPCTMCYDGPTKWNHNQPGKCFCDEFIARGEDPCPQCEGALCKDD